MDIFVTRRYRYSASHRLHTEALSEEENQRVYGKCNHPYGHGHDYLLEVTLRGPVDPETASVVSVVRLDRYVRSHVLDIYEGKYLNLDVPPFDVVVPTAENMARDIENRLRAGWEREFSAGPPSLAGVRLEETRKNTVEIGYEIE